MSGEAFRSFQEGRPDHERWELIEGVPVMMVPPLMEHNLIASNLANLLNAALLAYDPKWIAIQRPGVEFDWPAATLAQLERTGAYRPEPDVAVVDYHVAIAGERFTDTVYLLAEVISSTDEDLTPSSREPWIAVKTRLYQAHRACDAILLIEQDQVAITVHLRTADGWRRQKLTDLDAALLVPSVGLSCTVGDVYADTRWRPRR
jgi:Uma2 family endonuclease